MPDSGSTQKKRRSRDYDERERNFGQLATFGWQCKIRALKTCLSEPCCAALYHYLFKMSHLDWAAIYVLVERNGIILKIDLIISWLIPFIFCCSMVQFPNRKYGDLHWNVDNHNLNTFLFTSKSNMDECPSSSSYLDYLFPTFFKRTKHPCNSPQPSTQTAQPSSESCMTTTSSSGWYGLTV